MSDQENEVQSVPSERRRPRASVGGPTLKLDAPSRPGFVRRFVNGDPNRILELERLGYTVVTDKPGQGSARTDGKGTRITRHAGRFEDGSPMHAVLMETPAQEHAYGAADKEESRRAFEETIRRSGDPTGQVEGSYAPEGNRSTIEREG